MKAKIKDAVKEAMKARNQVKVETLRSILSAVQYEEIQKGVEDLPADGIISVLKTELKKRKEEVEFADKANRPELKEKLALEMAAIEAFLPKQLSSDEIEAILKGMKEQNASLNMGLAMKALKDSHSGQYDGKLASDVAKKVFG